MNVTVEDFSGTDKLIIVEDRVGIWPWRKDRYRMYVGSGTVWHSYPNGKRQPLHTEMWLCDLAVAEKFKGPRKPAAAATSEPKITFHNWSDVYRKFPDVRGQLTADEYKEANAEAKADERGYP